MLPCLHRFATVILFAGLPLVSATAQTSTNTSRATTTPAVTEADLKTRVYIFADDSMSGRSSAQPGGARGVAYIVSELKRLGLEPAGENGTYVQDIMDIRELTPNSMMTVKGASLKMTTDYLPWNGSLNNITAGVIYGGNLIDKVPLTAAQVAGKFVVLNVEKGQEWKTSIGETGAIHSDAAGIIYIGLDSMQRQKILAPQPFFKQDPPPVLPHPAVWISNAVADSLFDTPIAQTGIGMSGKPVTLRFDFQQRSFPDQNVIAIVRGSDAALSKTYIAIGAHHDHIGTNYSGSDHDSVRISNRIKYSLIRKGIFTRGLTPEEIKTIYAEIAAQTNQELSALGSKRTFRRDTVSNGADDDGSGSMAMLELAEYFVTLPVKPKRSILFVWHASEERGLRGSDRFTKNPTIPMDSVVTQLNLDMIGRGRSKDASSPEEVFLVGSRRLSTQLGDLVESVNAQPTHQLRFNYEIDADGHPQNIYCRSDHWNYARLGIPITFFFTGIHEDYHSISDEPQYLNYPFLFKITTLVRDIVTEIANRNTRLLVDKEKPGVDAVCRQ